MEDKRTRINVYLTEELKQKAHLKAKSLGVSLSAIFLIALDNYLKQDNVVDMAEMLKLYKDQIFINDNK